MAHQSDPARSQNGANLDIRSREAGMTALHLAVTRAATLPVGNTLQQQGDEAGKVRSGGPEYANLSDSLRHGCMHLLLAAGASTELEDHRKLCEQTAPQSHRILVGSDSIILCPTRCGALLWPFVTLVLEIDTCRPYL